MSLPLEFWGRLFILTVRKFFFEEKKAVITEAPKEDKEKASKPTVNQESIPTPTIKPTVNEFSNWITYQNDKFKYRLKYDPTWSKAKDCDTANNCFFQGDVSTKGWPNISIGKKIFPGVSDLDALKTRLEELFSGAKIKKVVFSQQEIPAVYLFSPRSPQAYANEEYYFFHKGEILSITLLDSDNNTAKKIYNYFLSNFQLIN